MSLAILAAAAASQLETCLVFVSAWDAFVIILFITEIVSSAFGGDVVMVATVLLVVVVTRKTMRH